MPSRPLAFGSRILMVSLLAVCVPALADSPSKPAKAEKVLMALSPQDIDPHRLIAPPPSEGSEAAQDDLAALHRVISERTPQRLAQAKWDDEHEDPSMYYATIGDGFDLKSLPATAALLTVVMNDQAIAASTAKRAFPRKRPWASDATIPTCDPADKPMTSYPSGHATMAFSLGLVLATLLPEKAEAIETRAADYAFSREVCGSHYAGDTEASHALGTAVAIELLNSPALQSKLAAARAELRQARFTGR